jgi:surfactin family lipopeptide synthetase C
MSRTNIIEDMYPLSPMQQGMLFHTLQSPDSGVYVEQMSCTLRGELDVRAFRRAWQRLVDRHTVLRTAFNWSRREEPFQVVYRRVRLAWEEQDWRESHDAAPVSSDAKLELSDAKPESPSTERESSGVERVSSDAEPESSSDAEQRGEHLEEFLRSDRQRGLDLSKPPPMRLTLIRAAEDSYFFVWSIHHIVTDGWSMPLMLKEVFALYEAFRQGREEDASLERPRPYGQYIAWLQRQNMTVAENFWRETLGGFNAPTPLGVIRPAAHAAAADAHGDDYGKRELFFSAETTNQLQTLARGNKLTMNLFVQAAWALLLSRYGGERDVVFGATVSGRPADLPGVEGMMGLFINTLPVRARVEPDEPLLPWLKRLQEQQVEARRYEYSPLVEVQGWSDVPRGLPLFESLVVFENYPVGDAAREHDGSIEILDVRVAERTNFPLALMVAPGAELSMRLDYDRARLDDEAAAAMLRHLGTLLEEMAARPEARLKDLSLLSADESRALTVAWNDTRVDFPQECCIHTLFEAQVERTPGAVALVYEGERVTYRELNDRANRLARRLLALGVGPEWLVGVCAERSIETVVGQLAVLKAGGAYLPLDPAYPRERLRFMLEDADVSVLLAQTRFVAALPETHAPVVRLDADGELFAAESSDNPEGGATAGHPAYLIYTSGSTGTPKGVVGLHRGAVNRFAWMWMAYPFGTDEVGCQKTSLSFVDSIWETFGPLLAGVPNVIIPDAVLADAGRFVAALAAARVSRLVLVPSLLRVMLESFADLQDRLPALKYWVTSGEALTPELQRLFSERMPQAVLVNLYGSSEVAADATAYDLRGHDARAPISIGRPISNMRAYVLDDELRPIPAGVTGELYVGGSGLARGYLRRPALTAERFLPDPFGVERGARIYRTGDLARHLPDGNLEFVGRADRQVKVRGFRIELGEIESVLGAHDAVREAVVTVREDATGGGRLVAYIVTESESEGAGRAPSADELRVYASERLPEYMTPSAFVMLERLPLTPSGKVDRRSLPEPEAFGAGRGDAAPYQPPETETEKEVAGIWSEVLGVEQVGVNDNFFDLGGHSLMVMQVLARMRASFGVELELPVFFGAPTVRGVAEAIETAMLAQAGEVNLGEMLDLLGPLGGDDEALKALGKEGDEG